MTSTNQIQAQAPEKTTENPAQSTQNTQPAQSAGRWSRFTGGVASVAGHVANWVPGIGFGSYLGHEGPSEERKVFIMQKGCGSLIEDLSEQITQVVIADSNFLAAGRDTIKTAAVDFIGHVYEVLATDGIAEPGTLSGDELADHFLATILRMAKDECTGKDVVTRDNFRNIANRLLRRAFPDEIKDKKIPYYLRELLAGHKPIGSAGIYKALQEKGMQDISWQTLTNIFAEHLEDVYNKINHTCAFEPNEETAPGLNAFIKEKIQQLDTLAKETGTIPLVGSLKVAVGGESTNEFINNFLIRLLKGNFTRPEDKALLDEARSWLLERIEASVMTVYTTILVPREGQSAEERRYEFAEHIVSEATKNFPHTRLNIAQIDAMDAEALLASLTQLEKDEKQSYHLPQLLEVLAKLKSASAKTKDEIVAEAKTLLKSIEAFHTIETILKSELNVDVIKPLLPSFLDPKKVFELIYSSLAPYVVQITSQVSAIQQKGQEAEALLNAHKGSDIAAWVDKALKYARGLLETKAVACTLKPTGLKFVDDLLCHVLKPSAPQSSVEAKSFIDTHLRYLIMIIIQKSIGEGVENPEQAIADTMDRILQSSQEKVLELAEAKNGSRASLIARCKHLDPTFNENDIDDALLIATYEKLFVKNASQDILGQILSKELFNELLPPFLRTSNLWENICERLGSYIKGLSAQTEKIQSAGEAQELTVQLPQLKALHKSLTKKLLDLIQAEAEEDTSLDRVKKHLLKGAGAQRFMKSVLPTIVEAFLAHHINPTETQSSEERAAKLFMLFVTTAQRGFNKIDEYELAEDKESWLQVNGYTEQKFNEYRTKHDIPAREILDIRIFLLHEIAENVVATLLPKDLIAKLVPEEFAFLNIEERLAKLSYAYIKDTYDYSHSMKQLSIAEPKPQVDQLKDLQDYVEKQLHTYYQAAGAVEKTWVEGVTREVFTFTAKNDVERALLLKFTTNIYLGAMGFIFKNAKGIPEGSVEADIGQIHGKLLKLFAPVAASAQDAFLILNSNDRALTKRAKLGITDDDVHDYKLAIGKPDTTDVSALDIKHLAYWVAGRKALDRLFTDKQWKLFIPEFLQSIFTKDTAATFATAIYETVHQTQEVLQQQEDDALVLVRHEPGLEAFIEKYLVDNVKDIIKELGTSADPLNHSLPSLLDSFLKECYADTETEVGTIRDTVMHRLLYTMVGKVLSDSTPVLDRVCELVRTYNKGDNQKTASLLLETCLPEEVTKTPLAKLIISQVAHNEIVERIVQVKECQEKIKTSAKEAKDYLDRLPGMKPFVADIIEGLDDTFDKIANDKDEKLSNDFPVYIDNLLKEAMKDDQLKPIIKEGLHNIVYIVMQQVLTPHDGQTIENRVLEVGAKLVTLFNAPDSQATGVAWLKTLLPESKLKELLPTFLQDSVTHDRLMKWFFKPYVEQVVAQKQLVDIENAKEADSDVTSAQGLVKKILLDHTTPEATRGGLLSFSGVVRELERSILGTLTDNKDAALTPAIQGYLNATVSQITRTLKSQGKLDQHFFAEGLVATLDHLDSTTAAPEKMPSAETFSARATEALLAIVYPNGQKDLLVPDVAKNFVWEKATQGIQNLFNQLTDPDLCILFSLDRIIPLTTDNKQLIGQRLQVIEDMRKELVEGRKPSDFAARTETLFKLYTREAAVHQVDQQVKKSNLWGPFKWLARQVAKAVTYLATRFSLAQRAYTFVAAPEASEKFRRVIWSFLKFTPPPVSRPDKELEEALKKKLQKAMNSASLAPASMQGFLSKQIATFLANKNVVQLLTE